MSERIGVQIYFDAGQIQATFLSQADAKDWLISTLRRLLDESELLASTRIEIRRFP